MAVRDSVYVDVVANTKKASLNMKGFAAGVAIAVAAVAGLVKVGKELVDAYAVQEQAEVRLAAAIKSTGKAAGLSSTELINMAGELQYMTKFGDEAIISSQAMLLTFTKIGKDVFPTAQKAILNVSEAMGQDLKTSTIQIGKALNDPIAGIGALSRVGIQLTQDQKDLIKSFMDVNDVASAQKIILEELEVQFGGVAEAAADTATGAMVQLKNALGDLKELAGGALAEGMRPLTTALTDFIKRVADARKDFEWMASVEFGDKIYANLEESNNALLVLRQRLIDVRDAGDTVGEIRILKAIENAERQGKLFIAESGKYTEQLNKYRKEGKKTLEEIAKEEEEIARILKLRMAGEAALLPIFLSAMSSKEKELYFLEKQEKVVRQLLLDWKETDPLYQDAIKALEIILETKEELNKVSKEAITESKEQLKIRLERIDAEEEGYRVAESGEARLRQIKKDNDKAELERLKELKELKQDIFDTSMELTGQFFDIVNEGYDILDERLEMAYEREKEKINDSIKSEEWKTEMLGNLDEQMAEKRKKIARDAAKWQKAQALVEIAVNTAVAITKAVSTLGPIAGPIAAIIMGGLGVAQAAIVSSQPVPMAEGGIVTGPTEILAGEAGPEAIIPLNKMSGMGGGNITIHIHGSLIHERELESVIYRAVQSKAAGY